MNQLTLVQMGAKVSNEFDGASCMRFNGCSNHTNSRTTGPSAHLALLTSLLSRINKNKSAEAYVLLLSTLAHAKLLYGDLQGTKVDMDEASKVGLHISE